MRMRIICINDCGPPAIKHASPHVALNDPDRHTCADACGREGLIRTGREQCASNQMPCELAQCCTYDRRPPAPGSFRGAGKDRKVRQTVGGDIAGTTYKIFYECLMCVSRIVHGECLFASILVTFVVFTMNVEIEMRMRIICNNDCGPPAIMHASPHVALNDPDRQLCADACGREGLIRTGREQCASYQMPCELLACRL